MGGGPTTATGAQSGGLSWNNGGNYNNNFTPEEASKRFGSDVMAYQNQGPAPIFQDSLYTGQGAETKGAMSGILDFAKNAQTGSYGMGTSGAMDYLSDTAAGNKIGMEDPGYRAVRDKVSSDTLAAVNSSFSNMGRYGSGSHVKTATDEMGAALGGMDTDQYNRSLDRQVQAAGLLPTLYQNQMMPQSTQLQIGQMQDADANAQRQGDYEQFLRTSDPNYTHLTKVQGLLTGQAQLPQKAADPTAFDWLKLAGGTAAALL